MVAAGGAGAESGAGLGLIGKAKELFRKPSRPRDAAYPDS